jgi:hypothetical protein
MCATHREAAHPLVPCVIDSEHLRLRPDSQFRARTLGGGKEKEDFHLDDVIDRRTARSENKRTQRADIAGYAFLAQASVPFAFPREYRISTQPIPNICSPFH